jgi:methionyl-tRNA formyltransferase
MTRVVFMGTPEFAVPSLAALLGAGHDIAAVVTREDRGVGRGQRVEESAVKRVARSHGIAVLQPRSLRAPEAQEALVELRADLFIVAAFGLILPPQVLRMPSHGCLSVHGSTLPRYRGAAPVAAAILAGEQEAGISIMLMDEGVDSGPVLSAAALPIRPDDTAGTLSAKLSELGARLLVAAIPRWLTGELRPRPQPSDGATFAPRIRKSDGHIDWREPAVVLERKVRAYQPWPTAFTTWNGLHLKVLRTHLAPTAPTCQPGCVIGDGRRTAGIIAGGGVLWLDEVQLAGKRALPIEAFLRGASDFVGSILSS